PQKGICSTGLQQIRIKYLKQKFHRGPSGPVPANQQKAESSDLRVTKEMRRNQPLIPAHFLSGIHEKKQIFCTTVRLQVSSAEGTGATCCRSPVGIQVGFGGGSGTREAGRKAGQGKR